MKKILSTEAHSQSEKNLKTWPAGIPKMPHTSTVMAGSLIKS